MLRSLIVGFGRAGRGLHLHCLRKAFADEPGADLFDPRIGAVDPRCNLSEPMEHNLELFSSLDDVTAFDKDSTVVHICTPPEQHLETLRQVAERGYTKIIMEKPLTTTLSELKKIREVHKEFDLDLLVVANWLSSSLTDRLYQLIQSEVYGQLRHVTAIQNKSRLSRTLANQSHGNAFDVEIPHLVALIMFLGGTKVEVVTAEADDMHIDDRIIPGMGRAHLSLLHRNGLTSELLSDLEAPVRQRCIHLYFDQYRVVGYYPSGQDDSYSRIRIYSAEGHLISQQVMYDDPLTSVFTEYYQYYAGHCGKPISDMEFNAAVIAAIHQAKAKSGLILEEKNHFSHEVIV
ncbi:putative oxidoreductase [compost metagenome]